MEEEANKNVTQASSLANEHLAAYPDGSVQVSATKFRHV